MPILSLFLLLAADTFATDWVTKQCDELSEFPKTWSYIINAEPHLGNEIQAIKKESGDTPHVVENGGITQSYINMTNCEMTIPFENGSAVDGLRSLVTYKKWERNGNLHAGGVLVEYIWKKDPATGSVTRLFVSTAVCRGNKACERRGIIKKTSQPTEPGKPNPIILEPSPRPEMKW